MARDRALRRSRSWGELVLVDVGPDHASPPTEPAEPVRARGPLACRLRLWHRWRKHHVPGGGSYLACSGCGVEAPDPLFARPWE